MSKNFILEFMTMLSLTMNVVMFIAFVWCNGQLDAEYRTMYCILWGISLAWLILFTYVNVFRKVKDI